MSFSLLQYLLIGNNMLHIFVESYIYGKNSPSLNDLTDCHALHRMLEWLLLHSRLSNKGVGSLGQKYSLCFSMWPWLL